LRNTETKPTNYCILQKADIREQKAIELRQRTASVLSTAVNTACNEMRTRKEKKDKETKPKRQFADGVSS
jgi:hypothetical protein